MGVEPNAAIGEHARAEFGLDVRTSSLEAFATDEPVDLVAMIQVLPHLWDLRRGLDAAAVATKPGGYWLIETCDRSSLTARLFGTRWHEYSPPSVCTGSIVTASRDWRSCTGSARFATGAD